MHIVIAGGGGFLGTALVRALRLGSHRVAVLSRSPRGPDDVRWSPGGPDLRWTSVIDDADAVINLAGEPIADRRWTKTRKRAILDSRVRATRALVAGIKNARRGPAVLISGSAVGVYGPRRDEPLTEESAPGADFLASVCKAWEAEAIEATGISRVVLLRTGIVLGTEGGALPKLALPMRLFAGGRMGSGRQYMPWIHRDDWVSLVQWALATSAAAGPLNLTAPEPVTNADFARILGGVLHRPARVPAPGFALRILLGEMADAMLLSGQRVLPRKAQALGFRFAYAALEPALRTIYAR